MKETDKKKFYQRVTLYDPSQEGLLEGALELFAQYLGLEFKIELPIDHSKKVTLSLEEK